MSAIGLFLDGPRQGEQMAVTGSRSFVVQTVELDPLVSPALTPTAEITPVRTKDWWYHCIMRDESGGVLLYSCERTDLALPRLINFLSDSLVAHKRLTASIDDYYSYPRFRV